MTWNPDPKVAAARDYGKKFGQDIVILISLTGDLLEYASWGKTKALCTEAASLADIAFEKLMEQYG